MYALLVIDETMVSSQSDKRPNPKTLKSDGVTKIHEHSFLVDLAKASLALADLQIMAKSKHRILSGLLFSRKSDSLLF